MSYHIQRAVTPLGSTSGTAVVPHEAVDLARSFPLLEANRLGSAGRSTPADVDLGNLDLGATLAARATTSYEIRRAAGAELEDHDYYSAVIEDRSADQARDGFWLRDFSTLQMDAGFLTTTAPAVGSIVDPAQAMVWPCAIRSTAPGATWGAAAIEARLTGSQEPQVERSSGAAVHRSSVATIEWGSSWSVTEVPVAVSATGGASVAVSGAGSDPWDRKFMVASYRVPAGAHAQADNLLLRADPADPDQVLAWTPIGAATGTYNATIYVLSHPRLSVAHWSSIDDAQGFIGGLGITEDTQSIPARLGAFSSSELTVLFQGTNTGGGILSYPLQFWGHWLGTGSTLDMRRGRSDTVRFTATAFQAILWPQDVSQLSGDFRGGGTAPKALGRGSGTSVVGSSTAPTSR